MLYIQKIYFVCLFHCTKICGVRALGYGLMYTCINFFGNPRSLIHEKQFRSLLLKSYADKTANLNKKENIKLHTLVLRSLAEQFLLPHIYLRGK